MAQITVSGEVVYPMGPSTRASKLDEPADAKRFRDWWAANGIETDLATTTSITGPDDGSPPLIYFGGRRLVARCSAGDRATIVVESRNRSNGRGIETTDLHFL